MNVWLALVHEIHPHHEAVKAWADSLDSDSIVCFCRFTQLGFLRLLTNQSAMRADVLTQMAAWEAFDALLADPDNQMIDEPDGIDPLFRQKTSSNEASTKQWAYGYLGAFAAAGKLSLVTLDRALAARVAGVVLLR